MDKAASPIEAGSTLFYGHIRVNQQPVEIFKVYGRTDLTSHVKILISIHKICALPPGSQTHLHK